jgi:CheY-like chemotaxis protein
MAKKRLLLVDDDPRNIFALTALLKSRSFDCVSCASAPDALTLLQTDRGIDAILLDMMMPDMDGYEAIPRIQALPGYADIPIYAVTAQAMVGDREKCLRAGATDYISKPIDVDRLVTLLSAI